MANPSAEYGQLINNKRKPKAQPKQSAQTNETGQTAIVNNLNLLLHSHDAQKNSDGSFEWIKQDGWIRTLRDSDILRLQFIYGFASLRNYWFINQSNNRILMRITTRLRSGNRVACIGPMRLGYGTYHSLEELNAAMQHAFDSTARSLLNVLNRYGRGLPLETDDIFTKGRAHHYNVYTALQIADGKEYKRDNANVNQFPNELQNNPTDYVYNYYNKGRSHVPYPKPEYLHQRTAEDTFPDAYRESFYTKDKPGAVLPAWHTNNSYGSSNRAMFILGVCLAQKSNQKEPFGQFEADYDNNFPGFTDGIEDADLGIARYAGISVRFFTSNDAPQGPQVFGAYSDESVRVNEESFAIYTVSDIGNEEEAFSDFVNEDFPGNFYITQYNPGNSAWVIDHQWKTNERPSYTGTLNEDPEYYASWSVGYSPLQTTLGSEGNDHMYIRVNQVNSKNIQTPYIGSGFETRHYNTSKRAEPSDVLGVMHTTPDRTRVEANISDSSGSEHSNGWFMMLADKIVTRIQLRITDTANNDVASLNNNKARGNSIPFMVALRADVIRNLDHERVKSQQTAQGVTVTPAHTFLDDTTIEGSNAQPYTNKPVF